jgi:hypothetical protein
MTLGNLISKINKRLVESYGKNSFKSNMKNFSKLVIEDKSFSKIYNVYSDLSKNMGFSKEDSLEYINEGVRIVSQYKNNKFIKIMDWVQDVVTENEYSDIDMLVYGSDLSKVVTSKKKISENLQRKQSVLETVKLPLSTIIGIANKQIESVIETLSESEKQEFVELVSKPEESIKEEFESLKEKTIEKLSEVKNTVEDLSVKNKISETIEKVSKENSGKIELIKMRQLYNSL